MATTCAYCNKEIVSIGNGKWKHSHSGHVQCLWNGTKSNHASPKKDNTMSDRPPIWATCPDCDEATLMLNVIAREHIYYYKSGESHCLEYNPHDWGAPQSIECTSCSWCHKFNYHDHTEWPRDLNIEKEITRLHFQKVMNDD